MTKNELLKDFDYGSMVIKGTCYEDIVSILSTNGYDVTVDTDPYFGADWSRSAKHKITYSKNSHEQEIAF